jgi:uncharacterized Fe-S cluster protein YjdI
MWRTQPQLRRHPCRNIKTTSSSSATIRPSASMQGNAVRGLPSVFNVSKKPWIDVNGASPAAIIEQVKLCPSGALTYELLKDAP